MAVSDKIESTVDTLLSYAKAGDLTPDLFNLAMGVLLDAARDVRQLEAHVVPAPARLTSDLLKDGKVVVLAPRGGQATGGAA